MEKQIRRKVGELIYLRNETQDELIKKAIQAKVELLFKALKSK